MFVEKHVILHLADAFGTPNIPTEIDLGHHDAPMLFRQLESATVRLAPHRREAALRQLRLVIPAPETHGHGVVLLPGGAVALRCGVEGVMVSDPHTATAFCGGSARNLRARIATLPGVLSLSHHQTGVQLQSGLPDRLPLQSCSIVPDATALAATVPALRGWTGRALVQWRPQGAVAWRLVEAPPSLALVASVAGAALEIVGSVLPTAQWSAADLDCKIERIAPGLYERVNDLLVDEVSDKLRWSLAEHAISGECNQAERLAEALRLLPALFSDDPGVDTGACLLNGWSRAADALAGHAADLALLGIEAGVDGVEGLSALRSVLHGAGLFLTECGPGFLALGSRQARVLAQQVQQNERHGALITLPASPHELFALAATLARAIDGRVVVAAPCWNFYHRFDARTEAEAGNAIWFGMGAGLDELEWL